jgi:2-dehydropantoate 2-reductase
MKVCVFGAGAIGGYIAAKLGASGNAEISCVARGPHLVAMKDNGLTLRAEGETVVTQRRCTDDAREPGPED